MTEQMLQLLIQGGLASVALVLIWVLYKIVTNHGVHFQEAFDRNTDAIVKNAEAMGRLTQVIEDKIK